MTAQGFSETLKGQGPCCLEELSGLCFPIVWTNHSPFGPTHSVLSLLGIINFSLLTLCSLTFYSLCSFSCQVFGGTPACFQVRAAKETSEWTVLPHTSLRKPSSQGCFHSLLEPSLLWLQAEEKAFLFCVPGRLVILFWGSAPFRFVYQHQSWAQLCLFVGPISMKPADFSRSGCVLNNWKGSRSHGHRGKTGSQKDLKAIACSLAFSLTMTASNSNHVALLSSKLPCLKQVSKQEFI